jgi:hypothetical protein
MYTTRHNNQEKAMFEEDDLIFSYSRKQAIADGILIDVTSTAKEAGFRFPVALTRGVWDRYVEVPEGVHGQDEAGRLWDILFMLHHAIRAEKDAPLVLFRLYVRNDNSSPLLVTLKAICAGDDDGSPCVTILLPTED